MASSAVAICNMALMRIGVKNQIDSLTEDSEEAEACNAFYAQSRDALLAECRWPFATRRSTLTELPALTRTNFEYVYSLPSDYISAQFIEHGGSTRTPGPKEKTVFKIELNDAGNALVLLTDMEDAELVYTAQISETTLFSPLFTETLTWLLAREIAMPLAVKPEYTKLAHDAYVGRLERAVAAAMRDSQEDAEPESEFITGRG